MPPSNRFPILRLPLLPFELIAKFMRPWDIISLAVSSLKVHKHLLEVSVKLESLSMTKYDNTVSIFLHSKVDYDRITLELISPEKWQEKYQNGSNILRIDGKQFMITNDYANYEGSKIYWKTEDYYISKETFFLIFKFLTQIFTSETAEIKGRKESLRSVAPAETDRLDRPSSELTSDELSSLLENTSIDCLELDWSVEEGVKYRKGFRYSRMQFRNAHWLTVDCLLNMESVSLRAFDVLLTIEDLKTFVKKWLEGGFEKLEWFELLHKLRDYPWKDVMDGFEKKPLEQADREKHEIFQRYPEDVWEIGRNDGKRAAVITAKHGFIFMILKFEFELY